MADADPIPLLNAALEGRYRVERELGAGEWERPPPHRSLPSTRGVHRREARYIDRDRRTLVAAEYESEGGSFRTLARRTLFVIPGDVILPSQACDVSADDPRFIMVRARPDVPTGIRRVVRLNFLESLRG